MYTVSIEGNVCSGKSSLLKAMRKIRPEWLFLEEPLEKWKNAGGCNLLQRLHAKNDKESQQALQTYVIHTTSENQHKMDSRFVLKVMERCAQSSIEVFQRDELESLEWSSLFHVQKTIADGTPEVNLHVYIEASSDILKSRIKKRSKPGDQVIDSAYLDKVDAAHKRWFVSIMDKVVTFNGNLEEDSLQYFLEVSHIVSKIEEHRRNTFRYFVAHNQVKSAHLFE